MDMPIGLLRHPWTNLHGIAIVLSEHIALESSRPDSEFHARIWRHLRSLQKRLTPTTITFERR